MDKDRRINRCLRSFALILTVSFLVLLGLAQPHASQGAGEQNKPGEKVFNISSLTSQYYLHQSPGQSFKKAPLSPTTAQEPNTPDPLHPSHRTEFPNESYKADEVLVRFKPFTAQSTSKAVMNNVKIRPMKHYKMVDVHLAKTPPGRSVSETIQQLKKNPSVEYAEPNYIWYADAIYPDDPDFSLLWGLHNTGQTGGTADADIDAPEAWEVETGSSDVVISVIDTGVDYEHVDLINNMWVNPGEIPGDGIDNDGNEYIDDIHGINAINGSGDPMDDAADVYHGTHCAGTIAAQGNNGTGVTGVSWSSKIMALKFLGESGSGSTDGAIECIEYMVNMKNAYGVNVKVSSNSWGGGGYSIALKDAINLAKDSDIIFIAAAGNAGSNNDLRPAYPASYDCLNIVSVAASDHNDSFASFSCYGYNSVDVAAPGVNIWSTKRGNDYRYLGGTSMATPHVAGLCALIRSHFPSMTYVDVKERLLRTVDKKSYFASTLSSGGRINAYAALTSADIQGPFIYSLSPAAASYNNELVIEGSQFGEVQGTGHVTFFDNLSAPIVSWSDHQIVCVVPPGCQSGPIIVTTDEALQSNEKIFLLAGSISGSVTKELSGDPLIVTAIAIYDSDGNGVLYTWPDMAGHYTVNGLPTGDYYAFADNYQGYINEWYADADPAKGDPPPIHVEAPYDTPNIDFELAIGGSIAGQVTCDPTGDPIADVGISLYDSAGDWVKKFTWSNNEGHYTITGVATGDYYVSTRNYEGYIDEWYKGAVPWYGNLPPVHVEAPNKTSKIDFALQIGGTVTGRVISDQTGEPLSDIELRVRDIYNSIYLTDRTDAEGKYSIQRLPSGDYYIQTFNDHGFIDEWYRDANPEEGDLPPIHIDASNIISSNIDFALTEGGSIAGRITADSTGKPLLDVFISVYDSTGDYTAKYTYSDSEGHYTIGGLPTGDYYVLTDNDQGYVDEWYADANPDEENPPPVHVDSPNLTPHIDFALAPGGTIQGVITDCADPLIGINDVGVCAYEWETGNSIRCSYFYGPTVSYEITGLPTGSYQVCAQQYSINASYARMCYEFPVPVVAEGIYNLDLCMEVGGFISGTIDCEGCSGGSIMVRVLNKSDQDDGDILSLRLISAPGAYSLGGLPYDTELWVYSDWSMSPFGVPLYSGSYEGNPITLTRDGPYPTDINIHLQKICDSDTDTDCDGICNPGESAPNCTGSDACPLDAENDADADGICGDTDNCPHDANAGQEDTMPPEGNGMGDACECESDFDCDGDVDGTNASTFKLYFGRNPLFYPCDEVNPCRGDFDCDHDCDGTDAIHFKQDFGRGQFHNPCPICAAGVEWCTY